MDMIAERLAAIPLLAGLTREQRHRLSRAAERLFIAPGKTLVDRGEVAHAAYLCLDDNIVAEYITDGESEAVILPQGSTVLEMAMIVETEAAARFAAEGHARVIRLPRERVLTVVGRDPDLLEALQNALTNRLNETAGQMKQLAAVFDDPPTVIPPAGDDTDDTEVGARISA
jgi:CRP-like cAMP-binding protein